MGEGVRRYPKEKRYTVVSRDALVEWRRKEGMTQTEAAEIAGVKLRSWQRWESGDVEVPQWLSDVILHRYGSTFLCPRIQQDESS